jgi:hypothetical protein
MKQERIRHEKIKADGEKQGRKEFGERDRTNEEE